MPPTSHFGSRLRRSLLLASFVRALVEAGSRGWSADKLSTLTPTETHYGCAQVGLKGTMNALDLTDRRQKMWRGLERQSGHFNTLVACM
jgi:hypothetical protein